MKILIITAVMCLLPSGILAQGLYGPTPDQFQQQMNQQQMLQQQQEQTRIQQEQLDLQRRQYRDQQYEQQKRNDPFQKWYPKMDLDLD